MYSLAAYGQMVADKIRTDAYAQALQQLIKPGDVVVDIGTGPGILALLACRLGARRVYAFEPSGIIELAREIAAANGFAERIEFIPKMSTESSLPEPANVIVSDIHGILPFFGKSLVSIIDARDRFLAPNGHMIPRSDTLWIAGIRAPEIYEKHIGPGTSGHTNSIVSRRHEANQFDRPVRGDRRATVPRTTPPRHPRLPNGQRNRSGCDRLVADRSKCPGHRGPRACSLVRLDPGRRHLVDQPARRPSSYLSAGIVSLARTAPGRARRHVTVDISAKLVGDEYVWRWDTQLQSKNSPNRSKPSFRQSTFFGADLSLPELRASASQFQPKLNEDGRIDHRILSLMEGHVARSHRAGTGKRIPHQIRAPSGRLQPGLSHLPKLCHLTYKSASCPPLLT